MVCLRSPVDQQPVVSPRIRHYCRKTRRRSKRAGCSFGLANAPYAELRLHASARAVVSAVVLDDTNVLGARTLRSTTFVVGDLLSLAEVLEPHALDRRHVKEYVGS